MKKKMVFLLVFILLSFNQLFAHPPIDKRSTESFYRYHEFRRTDGQGWLASGEYISTATVTAYEKNRPIAVTSTMVSGTEVIDGNSTKTKVKFLLKAGTSGKTYVIKINVVTSADQIFEDWYEVKVF